MGFDHFPPVDEAAAGRVRAATVAWAELLGELHAVGLRPYLELERGQAEDPLILFCELDDGLLDIVMLAQMPKRRFLFSLMPKVFKGTHIDEPEVTVLRAAELTISADRPFTVYADGDPIAELPATLRALRGAVQMVVPQ